MAIDYKKELETVARNMILVHNPDSLIKMIVPMIVNKAKINHASFFLYNKEKQGYLLMASQGSLSKKIPLDLICIDKDDVLIRFFKESKSKLIFRHQALLYAQGKIALKGGKLKPGEAQELGQVLYQMDLLRAQVCIPSYFREELLGLLFLGDKNNGRKFIDEELDFFIALNSSVAMALRNAKLFRDLKSELEHKHQLFVRTTVALAAAIEAKDHYTHGHTTRVTSLSLEIAKRIGGKSRSCFDKNFLENLQVSSLLHDIGKIGVPEYILNKRSGLTIGERNRVKEHPMIGVNILKPIQELKESVLGVKYHHERFDGGGYPEGLKGEQIPLIASIISVADSFDAMSTNRPYRLALPKAEAIKEIRSLSGRQFCPRVTDTFMELCQEGKI